MRLGISIKVVTRPEQRKNDGTNVIYLRITKDRKTRYLSTGLTATAADLSRDRKKIKNYQLLDQAEAIHRRARQILINHAEEFQVAGVARIVERLSYYLTAGEVFQLDFFAYARNYITGAKLAPTTKINATTALNAFASFVRRDAMNINDITNSLLRQFTEDLTRKGLKLGSVEMYVNKIVAMYRKAQEEYNDDYAVNIPRQLRGPKTTRNQMPSSSRALTIEQINQIIGKKLRPRSWEAVARDMFLVSFFMCGMNLIDIIQAKAPQGGVICFRRSKIADKAGASADMQITIPTQLDIVLLQYFDPNKQFFVASRKFGNRSAEEIIKARIAVGQALQKVSKKLEFKFTFYSARHSFATIARNVLKVDKATIDECLTHVGEHRMTDVYIKRDYSAVNAVCAAVADLFDLSKYNGGLADE